MQVSAAGLASMYLFRQILYSILTSDASIWKLEKLEMHNTIKGSD